MTEASRAFCATSPRKGLCIGVMKGRVVRSGKRRRQRRRYVPSTPNQWVELPIYTHLPVSGVRGKSPASRNHINVLTSDVLIVLPGGAGTLSEVVLRIEYGLPVILFVGANKIGGHSPEYFLAMARFGGQVILARSLLELRHAVVKQLGIHPMGT